MKPVELEVVRHEFGGATCEVVLPPRLSGPGDMQWGEHTFSTGAKVTMIYGAKAQPGRTYPPYGHSADMPVAYSIIQGPTETVGGAGFDGLTQDELTGKWWEEMGLQGASDTSFAHKAADIFKDPCFWERCISQESNGASAWLDVFHNELARWLQKVCKQLPGMLADRPQVLNGIYAHGAIYTRNNYREIGCRRSPADAHVFVHGVSGPYDVTNPRWTMHDANRSHEIRMSDRSIYLGPGNPYDKLTCAFETAGPLYGSARGDGPIIAWSEKVDNISGSGSVTCFTDGMVMVKRGIADLPFQNPIFNGAWETIAHPTPDHIAAHVANLRAVQGRLSDDACALRVWDV